MKVKEFSINRLGILARTMPDGETVVADVKANIKKLFGDGFERLRASDVLRLRDECYAQAPEQIGGAMKLLNVLIENLEPQAGGAKQAQRAATTAESEAAQLETTPADVAESTPVQTTAAQAATLLKTLRDLRSAAGQSANASARGTRVAALSLDEYAKPPAVLVVGGQGAGAERVSLAHLQWSKDGRTIRGSDTWALCDVDVTTGLICRKLPLERQPDDSGQQQDKKFSENGRYVFSTGNYRKAGTWGELDLYLWDAQTGKRVKNPATRSAAFMTVRQEAFDRQMWLSDDTDQAVSAHSSGMVYGYSPAEGAVAALTADKLPAQDFLIAGDGSSILAKGRQWTNRPKGDVYVRGTNRVHLYLRDYDRLKEVPLEDSDLPEDQDSQVHAFSDNGAFVAVRVDYEGMRVWDVEARTVHRVATRDWLAGATAAISNDGRILADLQNNNRVQLYDIEKGTPLGAPIAIDPIGAKELRFSPDGARLFVRGQSNEHRVIVFRR